MFEIGLFVAVWAVWAQWVYRNCKGIATTREAQRQRQRHEDRKDDLSFRSRYRQRRTRSRRKSNPRNPRRRPWQPTAEVAPATEAPVAKAAGEPDLYFGH